MAKGITSGYVPLGATVTRKDIGKFFEDHMFSHGATYAGHALGCATAAEVINIYETDNLIENSAVLGKYLLERGKELMEKHPVIGDVRGLGLFVKRLGELGMMAMAANPSNVIAMAPPLIATKDDIDEGVSIMDEALNTIDHYAEQ